MKAFTRKPNGTLQAEVSRDEALLLQNLASQVSALLREGDANDPAIVRLLPDAYPTDTAASEEFRRFTATGLTERKVLNANTVLATLTAAIKTGRVQLNEAEAGAWLRNLTDIRLTIASRLGIVSDDQGPSEDSILQDLYDWLGFIQNSLVEALDQTLSSETTTGAELENG